ncbi:hypothetical protein ERJ70_06440 [Sediminibacillus dalangtanensis]|uniref:Uncharacterized protein n=1 Tax=Sediminibacillus dalangtanensis TaxID=2729421 RepID=A0ABX7VPW7_9BACI|nr:hypothetical protein [Sediminibacillus dalangtanensis]QTM98972.1 hypothetical protein ERJ70_06440 [Sediminibacillus dalangtanensis]
MDLTTSGILILTFFSLYLLIATTGMLVSFLFHKRNRIAGYITAIFIPLIGSFLFEAHTYLLAPFLVGTLYLYSNRPEKRQWKRLVGERYSWPSYLSLLCGVLGWVSCLLFLIAWKSLYLHGWWLFPAISILTSAVLLFSKKEKNLLAALSIVLSSSALLWLSQVLAASQMGQPT